MMDMNSRSYHKTHHAGQIFIFEQSENLKSKIVISGAQDPNVGPGFKVGDSVANPVSRIGDLSFPRNLNLAKKSLLVKILLMLLKRRAQRR